MYRSVIALIFLGLLLAGCGGGPVTPVIRFIGVGTGTLATSLDTVNFRDRYSVTDRQLLGVVAFSAIADGTTVQATWFSPDDRRMPLGRTQIVTTSGATVARFSLGSKDQWEAAPYMLQIYAYHGEGEERVTASGSTQFFIGMSEKEISEYRVAYEEWKRRDAEQRRLNDEATAAEKALQQKAQEVMESPVAVLAIRRDVDGDGEKDVVFLDTRDEPEFVGSMDPSLPLATSAKQALVLSGSGDTLLGILRGTRGYTIADAAGTKRAFGTRSTERVRMTLSVAGTLLLTWVEDDSSCALEILRGGARGTFDIREPQCEEPSR